jgi:hypothetical protein
MSLQIDFLTQQIVPIYEGNDIKIVFKLLFIKLLFYVILLCCQFNFNYASAVTYFYALRRCLLNLLCYFLYPIASIQCFLNSFTAVIVRLSFLC